MIIYTKPPLSITLLAFLPLSSIVVTILVELVALHELCRDFYLRPLFRDYGLVVVTTIPYQFILAFASVYAGVRELFGIRKWAKTAHLGSHRVQVTVAETSPSV
jgi:hypothetical protein